MFRKRLIVVLAATALSVAAMFAIGMTFAGSGAGQLLFKGSLQAVENDVFDLPTIYIHGSGSGNATQLGRFTVRYDGTAHRENGVGISDLTAEFAAANGDRLIAKASGRGTPSETPGVNKIVELYTITGGTGRFAGATGSFTVERLLTLSTGVTSGSIDGNIVLPYLGTAAERYFPGKEQDDHVTADAGIDIHSPNRINAVVNSASVTAPYCDLSLSAARVRSEIPSEFIQPALPCDVVDSPDASVPPMGPHTVRDLIPLEFIQPVAP